MAPMPPCPSGAITRKSPANVAAGSKTVKSAKFAFGPYHDTHTSVVGFAERQAGPRPSAAAG
jgi:hypothetical protein